MVSELPPIKYSLPPGRGVHTTAWLGPYWSLRDPNQRFNHSSFHMEASTILPYTGEGGLH